MEIFQTIWTSLTTENEVLIKILISIFTIPEAYFFMMLFTTILNININKKQKILYTLLVTSVGILAYLVVPAPWNILLNILTCPLGVYFIFKTNFLKGILAEIINAFSSAVLGSITVSIYAFCLNISSNTILTIPIHKIAYSIIFYTFVFLTYLVCKRFQFNINLNDTMKRSSRLIVLINFIIGIAAIFIQSYVLGMYTDSLNIETKIISIFTLLLYFAFSLYTLSRTTKLEITTQQLEEEQLYNKTLNILYDNIRGFKHDFQNIMHSLGGYISTNNMEGLKTYYKELLPDSLKINQLDILNPESINNPAIYSLLTSKYHKADELGITMNIEAFLNMQNINMKTYELTRILGILLDNAIEAAKLCDKKIINVIIRKDNKSNRQLFVIENTYTNKDVNTDRIFEKGYTSKTKEDKTSHGLGLWEVRKILKKNNNLNLFTNKNADYFKQQLEIYI